MWLGIFEFQNNEFPLILTQTTRDQIPPTTKVVIDIKLGLAHQYVIMKMSRLLSPAQDAQFFWRILRRVYIIIVAQGSDKKKQPFKIYAGPLNQITWDASLWHQPDNQPLHSYTTKRHQLLNLKMQLERDMAKKWVNVLLTTFTLNWMEIWNQWRPKNEVGFIWSIYHGAWQQMSRELEPQ